MKTCVFCGEIGESREHIFAEWLYKRMDATDYPVQFAHRTKNTFKTRPPHGFNNYVFRRVCPSCNSGWMSDLEAWFQHNLGFLVGPEWPKMADAYLKLALKENDQLARWTLKTAIGMARNSSIKRLIDDETPKILKEGDLPPDLFLDVAYIEQKRIGGLVTPVIPMHVGSYSPVLKRHRKDHLFKALIQLNHLALRLVRVPSVNLLYLNQNNRFPIRAYPDIADPNSLDYRFHTMEEFDSLIEFHLRPS